MDLQSDAELLSRRDRKGAISNFVSFLAMLVMSSFCCYWRMKVCGPMPGISFYFQRQRMVNDPAVAKLWFDVNRIVQRVIFVTGYYGLTQGCYLSCVFSGAT